MIKACGVRQLWVKAKNQKLEELLPLSRVRYPSVWYWGLNWLSNFKWCYPLVAELQMTSVPLLSLRRYHLILFDSQPNKIANLPFPWALSFIVSFKTSPPELSCMWNFRVVIYTKFPSCYVYEIILYCCYIYELPCMWKALWNFRAVIYTNFLY